MSRKEGKMRIFDFYERTDGTPCPPEKDMPIGWHIMAVSCFLPNTIMNFFQRTFSHKPKNEP